MHVSLSIASGLVIGTPPITEEVGEKAQTAINTILAATNAKPSVGVFESEAEDNESGYLLLNKCRDLGLTPAFPPIVVKEMPTD